MDVSHHVKFEMLVRQDGLGGGGDDPAGGGGDQNRAQEVRRPELLRRREGGGRAAGLRHPREGWRGFWSEVTLTWLEPHRTPVCP